MCHFETTESFESLERPLYFYNTDTLIFINNGCASLCAFSFGRLCGEPTSLVLEKLTARQKKISARCVLLALQCTSPLVFWASFTVLRPRLHNCFGVLFWFACVPMAVWYWHCSNDDASRRAIYFLTFFIFPWSGCRCFADGLEDIDSVWLGTFLDIKEERNIKCEFTLWVICSFRLPTFAEHCAALSLRGRQ